MSTSITVSGHRKMTATASLGTLTDPHCDRRSDVRISFFVDGTNWEVEWGRFDAFGTMAYWVNQTVRGGYADQVAAIAYGADLILETVFCLLGGFGITAESARAACSSVRDLLEDRVNPTAEDVEEVLRRPLPGGLGRYRFPRQRAFRVADAVARLQSATPPQDPRGLRDFLLNLNGIGPKTAAWIVRNVTGNTEFAIIDIWLVRALAWAGVFRPDWRVERHYHHFEAAFLQLAAHGNVSPGALDLCIWEQARSVGHSQFARA